MSALLLISVIIIATPESHAAVNRSTSQGGRQGSGGPFGLGIMLGDPTGISAKYWMSGGTALALGLASSWHDYFEVFMDHDWHFTSAFPANVPLVPYVGIGAGLFFNTYDRYYGEVYYNRRSVFFSDGSRSMAVALRIPLGIEFLPRTVPFGAFLEVTPGLALLPGMHGTLQAALGARYYF
ncbi:MAG: hypothetical protein A2X94_12105 [Bdellovibrionales bacterium GWB1_55_8]|nr:MAG: hypothetical protein A2X94_12105 [Bdellovibrionales bacterium GWB1_55_8]